MKRGFLLLLALVLLVSCAAAEGALTPYTTRCGYTITYDAALYTPAEAGDSLLLQTNRPAYTSYILITASREQQGDPAGRVQQEIRDSGLRVNESTYCTVELPAGGEGYAARYPAMDGVMESVIVQQAGMEFALAAFYDSEEVEELYAEAFEAVLLSLTANPDGDLSGFEDEAEMWETDGYESDPYAHTVELYADVVRPFARTMSGAARQFGFDNDELAEQLMDMSGLALEDLNGDGTFELILYLSGEEEDAVCGLYTLDDQNRIIDWLPGMGAMYSYAICQAEDGSLALCRRGSTGDADGLDVCHFYRFGVDGPEFIEGYIWPAGESCYRAQDDGLTIPAGAKKLSDKERENMEDSYIPYQEEYAFTASVSDYFFVEGDRDAADALFGL